MSSMSTDSNGNRTFYVRGVDGRRRPIRLKALSIKQARTAQGFIDDLERAANSSTSPAERTQAWVAAISDGLREKPARAGLVERREAVRMGAFMERYFEKRKPTLKPRSLARLNQSKRHAVDYFTADKLLRDITEADAQDYRGWLIGKRGLAEATTRKICGDARMVFRYAIRAGLVDRNPFEAVPTAHVGNSERQRFITHDDAMKVMAELPDAQWRLLFALSRWGGLRVPSEPVLLTWADVDWEKHRLTVKSPKTAHHQGHEQRIIPLFPEIEAALREIFEQAADGTVYVLPFLTTRTGAALRKPLERAIKRAGLAVWPRLWHNMRASRQTELEERFPSHVVCGWLGNSESVARTHYLQTRDIDYERALEKVVRNPVRAMTPKAANARQEQGGEPPENASIRQETLSHAMSGTCKVPPRGVEPLINKPYFP